MRIYFDSVALIYYVEQVNPWFAAVQSRFTAGGVRTVYTDLSRMECRIKPLRLGNQSVLLDFEAAFAAAELVPLTASVFDLAAEIRARHPKFGTPDAIHLAASVESGCDAFLTNDTDLAAYTGITIDLI